jgi:hypothetical protein
MAKGYFGHSMEHSLNAKGIKRQSLEKTNKNTFFFGDVKSKDEHLRFLDVWDMVDHAQTLDQATYFAKLGYENTRTGKPYRKYAIRRATYENFVAPWRVYASDLRGPK